MNYPIHCATSRQNCATPYSCGPGGEACPMVSINCSGRTIANGRAVDYAGKEAEDDELPTLRDEFIYCAKFWLARFIWFCILCFLCGLYYGWLTRTF